MKVVPLSEFMPYGAPELLGSSRRHMMQALMLSSALVVLSFTVVGIVLMRMPPPVITLTPETPTKPHEFWRPLPIKPHDSRHPPVRTPDFSKPIPTHDVTEPKTPPTPDLPYADPTAGPESGVTGKTGEPDAGGGVDEPRLPQPDEIVYFDEMPQEVLRVEPVYPDLARDAQISGIVYARMLVGRDGRVLDVLIAPKHSIPMLNEAVITAARQWIFKPALVNKHPVAVWVGVQFNFKLH